MSFIMNLGARLFIERPAHNKTWAQLADRLEASGKVIANKITNAERTTHNHNVITHIIGIERWGQRRLQVALGEPFNHDEYDDYRPAPDRAWEDLQGLFEVTRAGTVALLSKLADMDYDGKIEHDSFGGLTVRGWLQYLNTHANRTARAIN